MIFIFVSIAHAAQGWNAILFQKLEKYRNP